MATTRCAVDSQSQGFRPVEYDLLCHQTRCTHSLSHGYVAQCCHSPGNAFDGYVATGGITLSGNAVLLAPIPAFGGSYTAMNVR